MAGEINYYAIAKELTKLPADTDSRDWPEAKKFLYELNQPLIWSQICLLAFGLARNAVIKIWLLIEYVNGWRRQPGKWDMQVALEALEDIRRRIDCLPGSNSRKGRLLELWLYQSGWVYHPAGRFAEAANCHEIAARRAEAAGNEWGRLVALFNAAYEWLNAAIVTNEGINECYVEFKKSAQNFLAILTGDFSDKGIRWHDNVYCHLIFYAWAVEGKYPSKGDIAFLDELPESLEPAFADADVVLKALCEFSTDKQEVVEITSQITPEVEVDWGSFAILVRISALEKDQEMKWAEVAREELDEFLKGRHGGHIARAILAHDLLK